MRVGLCVGVMVYYVALYVCKLSMVPFQRGEKGAGCRSGVPNGYVARFSWCRQLYFVCICTYEVHMYAQFRGNYRCRFLSAR